MSNSNEAILSKIETIYELLSTQIKELGEDSSTRLYNFETATNRKFRQYTEVASTDGYGAERIEGPRR